MRINNPLMQGKLFILLVILFTNSSLHAQAGTSEFSEVTLPRTEQHSIKSTFVDQEYLIPIYIPPSYRDTTKRFPVLYLLDADMSFAMAVDIVRWLSWSGEIPQIMVVGISYGQKQWWENRSRDYTPTKDTSKVGIEFPLAGGAKEFLSFLQKELIPYIDNNFRTTPSQRILAGLSFGGLFSVYTMLNTQDLFWSFIVSGPWLIWNNKTIFDYENEFAKKHDRLDTKIYSSIGELDEKDVGIPWNEFNSLLTKRNYKGFVCFPEVLKGETHISAWPSSITRGLKFVFKKP